MQIMFTALCVTFITMATVCQADWRVINGTDAIMHEYPSIVSIKFGTDHFCGGTLINKRTVLTASHCVFKFHNESESELRERGLVAVMGEHVLNKISGKERVIPVIKITVPAALYNERAFVYGNDIALLRLARDVVPEDHVRIAKYPNQGDEPSVIGQTCTVVGWGSLNVQGIAPSNILQKANLKIISNQACSMEFFMVRKNPSNICAGSGRASTSACRGDSGGPLFCRQSDGSLIQVGAVSYGRIPCGASNVPTVFTRVSNFANWIQENV